MKQTHPKGPETIEPGTFRLGYISLLAGLVGVAAGFIAYILYDLIGLFTNLAYYHAWSFHFRSPENTPFHYWIIVIPVIGGLIVGFMAKYGSDKIKGHGHPEAALRGHRHRHGRPIRRGRPHHSDRRRAWFARRAVHRDDRVRTQSIA